MGLDVYLYRCENIVQAELNEEEFDKYSEEVWASFGKEFRDLTDVEQEDAWARLRAFAAEHNLDEYGRSNLRERIEQDSKLYPDHLFKIGYFRSSYNAAGINSVLRDMDVPDLYYIFDVDDDYCVEPDWELALQRVNEVIEAYKAVREARKGYDAILAGNPLFTDKVAQNQAQAVEIFMKELEKKSPFDAYSNANGDFFLKGLRIYGIIPSERYGKPASYLIVKQEDGDEDWYLHALEIVRETIEYVLSQKDPYNYYLTWSA